MSRREFAGAVLALLAMALATWAPPAMSQDITELRADIRATYDFEPSTMSFNEQARLAPALSKLWSRYDRNSPGYHEALVAELRADGNREQLYCDGGMLLMAKSRLPEDEQLGLASIRKCSLAEIQHTPYFYTLHGLARRGVDTFDLQVRILFKPKYVAFVVQHMLTLRQDFAFIYPLLVQQESAYVPRLVALLANQDDATAQKSVVRALWYAATPEAEAAVRAAADDARLTETARAEARKLLQELATYRGWAQDDAKLVRLHQQLRVPAGETEAELRNQRRTRMRSVSDEALAELEVYTVLLYRLRS
jgi:hypothetical protein